MTSCQARVTGVSLLTLISSAWAVSVSATPRTYSWLDEAPSATQQSLEQRFAPPKGYRRISAPADSWAQWLRGLPMKPKASPVKLYTGARKWRQDAHAGVVDIDVGKRDLQQCADAIMRLRAEWLYATRPGKRIAFNDTKGRAMTYAPQRKQRSYKKFRKYLVRVFAYAGTYSLERELARKPVRDIAIGDVWIKGGFPGHAVLVVDIAVHPETGDKKFMLLQSYMPAQDMHILINPDRSTHDPWYDVVPDQPLKTPEWTFAAGALKTWRTN